MKLSNFDRYVPENLLARGADYFERGLVKELAEESPNHWYARVAGTEDYHVSVYVNNAGTILSSSCTCPFESDTLCKHEIAVCLAISDAPAKKDVNNIGEADVFQHLKGLKKAELLEILKELIDQQPAVNSFLAGKFAKAGEMDEEAAKRIIRQSAARAMRRGFIEWDKVEQAMEGAWQVQDYISTLDFQADGEQMICLNLVVAQECTKLLEQADDSAGLIGAVISVSIGMIDEVMERWPEDLDNETADEILQLLKAHTLFHVRCDMTDAAVLLVEAAMNWSVRFDAGKKIYDFIETIVTSEAVKNKTYRYEEERLRMFQLMILYQQNDEGTLEAFIETHREYPAIRKVQLSLVMEAGDFDKAIQLCEAYEQLDGRFAGLVLDWKMQRFEAYQKAGRQDDMAALAFELAASGKEEYYQLLKEMVPEEEWPKTVDSLLSQLGGGYWEEALYVNILISEGMTENLLEHCRSDLREIEALYPHLIEQHPHEVNELFTAYIYHLIRTANGRKQYRGACGKIKKYGQVFGTEAASNLIEEIRFAYPKRPALLDELAKL